MPTCQHARRRISISCLFIVVATQNCVESDSLLLLCIGFMGWVAFQNLRSKHSAQVDGTQINADVATAGRATEDAATVKKKQAAAGTSASSDVAYRFRIRSHSP